MQANDCVVCHKTVEPVAGLFQDFNEEGQFGPRKEGWHSDMFAPGLEGEELPQSERWRSLQWLGERTAKDPRFATAMVEHVWYILFGRKVLKAPQDIDDPLFGPRRRAYQAQRALIEEVAAEFKKADSNLKVVFKALALSQFYRADGLQTLVDDPCREAELDDMGLVRLLTPEQLERKITAVFGNKWGNLTGRESKFQILYGGIDSHAVTERVTEPSGAIGATDEKQFLVPIHPQSLATDKENGIRVRAEHIHLALRKLAGIKNHPLSERFRLDVLQEETLQGLWA